MFWWESRLIVQGRLAGRQGAPDVISFVDVVISQNVMSVDGEEIPGKALEKRWCLSLFLKVGRAEMNDRFNSIQAFIDAAYMDGQRRLTISSKSKSTLMMTR